MNCEENTQKLIAKLTGKPGKTGKIEAMCVYCIVDPYQKGTWREQVENCTSKDCPLFSERPLTLKKNARI